MGRLQWSDELSVGVEMIDNQHKELIRIANGLISAVSKKRGDRVVQNVIRRLRNYTVFHFNSEEKFMEDMCYPKRGEHEAEHVILKESVKKFQRTLYEKKNLPPDAVLDFLKIWLIKHILSADIELSKFVHSEGKACR